MRLQEYIQKNNLEDVLKAKKDWKFEISLLITEARLRSGLTQKELAKRMKTKQPSIARIENCKMTPSIGFLVRLARAIGTELVLPRFKFMREAGGSTSDVELIKPSMISPFFQVEADVESVGQENITVR